MINAITKQSRKSGFTSILFTLLMALQMSACSSLEENPADVAASNNDSGTGTGTGTDTGTGGGTNSPAVISGVDSGSVTEDVDPDADNLLEVGGKLNITDSDAGEAAFSAKTIVGSYGNLVIDAAGNWNYAASNSQTVIQSLASGDNLLDSMTISSVDGTTHTVVVTILGVDEGSLADVSLSWVAPVEREDNTSISLSEIAGYKVYFGTTQGQYSDSVTINDGTAESYTLTDFSTGTYYFVVTTLDTEGRESQYSTEVIVVL